MAMAEQALDYKGSTEKNLANLQMQEAMRQGAMQRTSPENIYRMGSWLFPGMLSDPGTLKAPSPALLANAAQSTRPGSAPLEPWAPLPPTATPETAPEEPTREGRKRERRQRQPRKDRKWKKRQGTGTAPTSPAQKGPVQTTPLQSGAGTSSMQSVRLPGMAAGGTLAGPAFGGGGGGGAMGPAGITFELAGKEPAPAPQAPPARAGARRNYTDRQKANYQRKMGRRRQTGQPAVGGAIPAGQGSFGDVPNDFPQPTPKPAPYGGGGYDPGRVMPNLFGTLPGLAKGGKAQAGQAAIVGEEGPEIAVATEDTAILPNPGSADGPGGMPPIGPEGMMLLAMLLEAKGISPGGMGGMGGGGGMPAGQAGPGGMPMMAHGGQLRGPRRQGDSTTPDSAAALQDAKSGGQSFGLSDLTSNPLSSGGIRQIAPYGHALNEGDVAAQRSIDVAGKAYRDATKGPAGLGTNVNTNVGLSAVPGELFRSPGEAITGHTMNMLMNPGQLNPIDYERAQEQANMDLNAGMLSTVGMMSGRGWDPNSPMGQMLQLANVNRNAQNRNAALRDLAQLQEGLYREDIDRGAGLYLQSLQQLMGLTGAQSQAAQPNFAGAMTSPFNATGALTGAAGGALGGLVTGMMGSGSSEQWKEGITTIREALSKVMAMRGVEYRWKDELPPGLHGLEGEEDLGLVAEEVDEVLPEAALRDEDGKVWGVKYPHVVGLLVQAIKEQQAQIEELKEEVRGHR